MAEAEVAETEQEGVVTLEEKHLPATEETCVRVFYTARAERQNESHSVTEPLLGHKHQDRRDENHRADTVAVTDGADRKTSVPCELGLAGRDEAGRAGSVKSLCSDSSRHECPICSELFREHCVTTLHCDHTLCHHCTAGIMRRAKDQSRLQCPFCRQTTPFPQWEIRRLQEESYSSSVVWEPVPGPAPVITAGPELQAAPASALCCFAEDAHGVTCGCCVQPSCLVRGGRLMRPHFLCFSITALLVLFLLPLGCLLYMVLPVLILFRKS